MASAVAKIISVGTTLISVPLTLHYLGTERYGMWITMSSVIAMLSFADFGMGNGLLNAVAEAHGRGDRLSIRRNVSSAYFVLTLIALLILLIFWSVYGAVPWYQVFNVATPAAIAEAGPALAVFIACFALSIPLGIVQRTQIGLQEGFTASLWQCAGSAMALAGVLLVIHFKGNLPLLVCALVGAPLVGATANFIGFFLRKNRDIAPGIRFVSTVAIRHIAHTGILFLILQVCIALTFASDSLVIAQALGAPAVAQYAVPEKLFSLISVLMAMILGPLWPAYGEALARGDQLWVQATIRRSLKASIAVATILSTMLIGFGPKIIFLWVGDTVKPSLALLCGLGLWKVIEAVGNCIAFYLNAANVIRFQIVVASTTAVFALVAKFFLVSRIGISGVVWATVVCYLAFTATPYAIVMRKRNY